MSIRLSTSTNAYRNDNKLKYQGHEFSQGMKKNECVKFENLNNYERAADISFSGFFNVEKHARKFAKGKVVQNVLVSDGFNNFIKSGTNAPGVYEALVAFAITCSLRPLAILAVPGAEKEDKKYAASQSIASGLVGLASSYALFKPVERALDNIVNRVNREHVDKALENIYKKDDATKELIDAGIIPDKLPEKGVSKSLLQVIAEWQTENKVADKINNDTKGLIEKFNKLIKNEYSGILNEVKKENGKLDWLLNESIQLSESGKITNVLSKAVENTKYKIGFSSKFLVMPLMAWGLIAAIPVIMKKIFPNHRKSKGNVKETNLEYTQKSFAAPIKNKLQNYNTKAFSSFTNNKTSNVAFNGVINPVSKAFDEVYTKPVSNLLEKLLGKIIKNDKFIEGATKNIEHAKVDKFGYEVVQRDKFGKEVTNFSNNWLMNKFPVVVANWGSMFYILSTVKNKNIEKDRKPALCLNMAFVAAFSTGVGMLINKSIEKVRDVFIDEHKKAMKVVKKTINFNAKKAWKFAFGIGVFTFTYRFLGPVLAAPAADKLTKKLAEMGILKAHKDGKPENAKA